MRTNSSHLETPRQPLGLDSEREDVFDGLRPSLARSLGVPIAMVNMLDGVIQVAAEAARDMERRSAREEGMPVGTWSGAALAAITQMPRIAPGSTVLGFNDDTGERHLSIAGFLPIA